MLLSFLAQYSCPLLISNITCVINFHLGKRPSKYKLILKYGAIKVANPFYWAFNNANTLMDVSCSTEVHKTVTSNNTCWLNSVCLVIPFMKAWRFANCVQLQEKAHFVAKVEQRKKDYETLDEFLIGNYCLQTCLYLSYQINMLLIAGFFLF